uniref:Lycopene beta-cyclase n=1 Tax=Kalanchoe fedtschenkoi TaxID=63787 RepID=A0A7N0U7F6_KALFE
MSQFKAVSFITPDLSIPSPHMAALHKLPLPPAPFLSDLPRRRGLFCPSPTTSPPKKRHPTSPAICCSKYGNFLDLKPQLGQETLQFPHLPVVSRSDRLRFDVVIIGAGPAGLRLAEQLSLYGIKVCCVDPSPLSAWPNNYGAWVDELVGLGDLEECFDHKWPMATVYIDERRTKYLDRPYGRVNRKKLKMKLLENCVSNGTVTFLKATVWKVEHQEFESSIACDDGSELRASLVVDASGFRSPFIEHSESPRNCGYQIAHGILAEVGSHPFDLNKMVLMDWRDSHMGNEPYLRASNSRFPTFLYAMPFDSNLIFLEETALVSRPALSYSEVKKRMVARLRHLGVHVKKVLEVEKCVIPMGGPLPRIPQSAVGIGATGGQVHPSTGYMMARTMALSPVLALAIAECLGSTRMIRGKNLQERAWKALWPADRRSAREFYAFGMETLLKLDLGGTRSFFDAFFDLDPYYWHGFLSSRLSIGELALLSVSLFMRASNPSRLDIITKCPPPLVKMVANLALHAAAT